MWELEDRNLGHCAAKERICGHCVTPESVQMTRTADVDLGLIPLTKDAVLEALRLHIQGKRRIYGDRMDNGDQVFVVTDCEVDGTILYVKVKFLGAAGAERMLVISAHPPRRWC